MQNIILSPVAIPDLVDMMANEMERRATIRANATQTTPAPPTTERKRLYGDKAAASHIGCTHLTMGNLRKSGKVRFYTLGTRYFYYADELDQDLQGGNRFGQLRGNRKGAK